MARLGELTAGDETRAPAGLVGRWRLVAWEITHGPDETLRPLGDDECGLLIYTADGSMAVQITAADRNPLGSTDPLGGTEPQRAAAYATCLAYCGRYEVRGETIVHTVEVSLFPDWAGAEQVRLFVLAGDRLTLRTPPVDAGDGRVTAELRWIRDATP